MLTIVNSKILDFEKLLDDVNACANINDLDSLLAELYDYTANKLVEPDQARVLFATINARRKNLTQTLSGTNDLKTGGRRMVILPNTAVSNRAGVVSVAFLLAGLAVTGVMLALIALALK